MLILSKKRIIIKILIIFLILFVIDKAKVFAVVNKTKEYYVNDYANLLNDETEKYIINVNKSLENKTGAQIVVVTIPSLEGDSIEDYSTELFRKFEIGDKTKRNGLLLLLALEERELKVEVGYGLEGILPDAKTGRIQDQYIIPYLKENKWNEGIKNGFNAFLEVVCDEYDVDVGGDIPAENKSSIVGDIVAIFFLLYMIFSIFFRRKRRGRFYSGGRYNDRSSSYRSSGGSSYRGGGGSSGGGGSTRKF